MSTQEKANFNWFPGHMNKTLKEINNLASIVDLIIEIVDSRAPYSTQNPLLRKVSTQKPRLIVMTKCDLADEKITLDWKEYFEGIGFVTYFVRDKTKNILKDIERLILQLTKTKQERDIRRGIECPQINVLVVGIPNVGKSTFIQNISKGKNIRIGNKPGVTRGLQRINLSKQITIIDTPGILPSKFESEEIAFNCVATNSVRIDVVPKEKFAVKMLKYLLNNYFNDIKKRYDISDFNNNQFNEEDCYKLLRKIKNINEKDETDLENASEKFINDLFQNKFGKISFEKPFLKKDKEVDL